MLPGAACWPNAGGAARAIESPTAPSVDACFPVHCILPFSVASSAERSGHALCSCMLLLRGEQTL